MSRLEIEGCDRYRAPFVLEGGAIHVDGQGTLITTEECLLNRNRNPGLTREQIEDELRRYLIRERDLLRLNNKSVADATVVIRADADAQTGWVQELIQLCQQERFEKFTLRAKEEVGH